MAKEPHFIYYHSSRPSTARQPTPKTFKRSQWKAYALFALLVVGFVVIRGGSQHANQVHAQKQASAIAAQTASETAVVPKIQAVLAQNQAVTFGISIVDVQTGNMTNLGTQTPFVAASTGKLITAGLYLHLVGEGKASLRQQIDGTSAVNWLKQMVVLSDNTAWANLNEYLTHPALAAYAQSIGINDYNTDDNLLAPHDIALLLQKLATGTLLPPVQAQLLLSYMKIANYRASIVPAVPAQDTVYHKIGFLDDYLHDAAIIQNPAGRKVVLVVYTNGNGTYNDDARNASIQQITRAVIQGYL